MLKNRVGPYLGSEVLQPAGEIVAAILVFASDHSQCSTSLIIGRPATSSAGKSNCATTTGLAASTRSSAPIIRIPWLIFARIASRISDCSAYCVCICRALASPRRYSASKTMISSVTAPRSAAIDSSMPPPTGASANSAMTTALMRPASRATAVVGGGDGGAKMVSLRQRIPP